MTSTSELDSSDLLYMPIDNEGLYGRIILGSISFTFITKDKLKGYINASALCMNVNKKFKNWLKLASNVSLIKSISSNLEKQKLYSYCSGEYKGYYIHHSLLPYVAIWINIETASKVQLFLDTHYKIFNDEYKELLNCNTQNKITKLYEQKYEAHTVINNVLNNHIRILTNKHNFIVFKNRELSHTLKEYIESLNEDKPLLLNGEPLETNF